MKKAKRILTVLLCFALIFVMGGEVILSAFSLTASAEESAFDINTSDPLSDLEGATIEGVPFSTDNYNPSEVKADQLLTFLEYGYSNESSNDFGLFAYVYSNGNVLYSKEYTHSITLRFGDGDYTKYNLKCLLHTFDSKNGGCFFKFRVDFTEEQKQSVLASLEASNRRYSVGELEMYYDIGKDFMKCCLLKVGQQYIYSGYMAAYSQDGQSSLKCTVDDRFETLSLNVEPTYYRTATSDKGAGYQKQLDTVIFSVPKRLMDSYGRLQRIKAEWYEYKTSPIVVTNHKEFYDTAKNWVGVYMGDLNKFGQYPMNKDAEFALAVNRSDAGDLNIAEWGWNLGEDYLHPACQRLSYLFYTDHIETYDFTDKYEIEPDVRSNDLLQYMLSYNSNPGAAGVPTGTGRYMSSDLFMDDIDDSRKISNEAGVIKRGYSFYDFDADLDLHQLKTWSSTNPSFWDNWINFGFATALAGGYQEETRECSPIHVVTASDLSGDNQTVADRLMIDIDDVPYLRQEYVDAKMVTGSNDEEMEVVLFRFAVSDFYSKPADIIGIDQGLLWFDKTYSDQAYIAQGSVFLNFDIIQLTFRLNGEETIIPVVMKPIDIVPEITPPIVSDPTVRMQEFLDSILKIVGFILFLIVAAVVFSIVRPFVAPVFKWIWNGIKTLIKWIFSLLLLPFRAIGNLFKRR